MHVLIIPSWYPESSNDINGSFFREQALALSNSGCTVGVIYPQHRSVLNWRKVVFGKYGPTEEIDEKIITIRWHNTAWLPRINLFGLKYKQWLRDGIKLYDTYVKNHGAPDLIHAHSTLSAGILAYRLHKKFEIPYVITEHSSTYMLSDIGVAQKRIANTAMLSANSLVTVSDSFRTFLSGYFEPKLIDWQVVPNLVDHSFSDFPIKIPKTSSENFTFINISHLNKNKGIDSLISAFSLAFSDDTSVRLLICGSGSEYKNLKLLAQDLKISDRIEFCGLLSRASIVDRLASADSLVLSSHYETFGVAVIEALALGKPVVATRCGGPEEIIKGSDGILTPLGDFTSLAAAMSQMRHTILKYNSDSIRTNCLDRYGHTVVTDTLKQIYNDVLIS